MVLLKNFKCSRQIFRFNQVPVCFQLSSIVSLIHTRSSSSYNSVVDKAAEERKSRNYALEITQTYGQPTAQTHPHLIKPDDLVPGVAVEEFQSRRLRLIEGIQKYARDHMQNVSRNHLVIIPSSTKKYMSDKIPYVFRQNSDFFYFSGCLEPDSALIITINEHGISKSIMFMRPKDQHDELWDGSRTGVDNAPHMFGVDEAYSVDEFSNHLSRLIRGTNPLLWYDYGASDLENISAAVRKLLSSLPMPNSPLHFMQGMRLYKSEAERELMRSTCKIASKAINAVIRDSRPGYSEHHIFAMVDYNCRMLNANHLAYPPVVATGENATTIHYINNTQLTKTGDMILMDAGCEYGGYSSDITRTWPIGGRFTEPQRVLYDVVAQVQSDLIGMLLKEGGDTLNNLFESMCSKLGKYLQEIGLVPKCLSDNTGLGKAGYRFCPHHVSHYLGMDVHDTPLMPRSLPLRPGMVFTVEPGIYIGSDRKDVPREFRGLGIRIEDDILITPDGKVEILTSGCIKDRNILENLKKP